MLRRPEQPNYAVRTPRADNYIPRGEMQQHRDEWDGRAQTGSATAMHAKHEATEGTMTRSIEQKVRARVTPLMELDPDVFEVILFGANMLPIVKRRHEFEQLSRQLQGMQSGTALLRINQKDPKLTAHDIQVRRAIALCA